MDQPKCRTCGERHRLGPCPQDAKVSCVGGAAVARRSHKPKVEGSIPSPATSSQKGKPDGTAKNRKPSPQGRGDLENKTVCRSDQPQSVSALDTSADVSRGARVKPVKSPGKLKRGRPKIEGARPWEAEGVSRRTWYRRKAGK